MEAQILCRPVGSFLRERLSRCENSEDLGSPNTISGMNQTLKPSAEKSCSCSCRAEPESNSDVQIATVTEPTDLGREVKRNERRIAGLS